MLSAGDRHALKKNVNDQDAEQPFLILCGGFAPKYWVATTSFWPLNAAHLASKSNFFAYFVKIILARTVLDCHGLQWELSIGTIRVHNVLVLR